MDSYKTYSDEQLIRLLKVNDEGAFTEIYLRYWKRLFVVGVNKIEDLQLAEEIVQDIFTDIWNRRFEIEFEGNLMPYLAAAMKYKVIDARLKKQRIKSKELKISHSDRN
ncbi:MAG: hypothetical protein J7497_02680, partial [Chitinophagaceae bacterium]|nr:hypothetical protein [Chitinophagaceae bacterium]